MLTVNLKNPGDPLNESRHPLQRISSKLVAAVLVAVLFPFFGLIFFIDSQIDTRLKENIVHRSLLGLATDLVNEVNDMTRKRNSDLLLMTSDILGDRSVMEYLRELENFKTQGRKGIFQTSWEPDTILKWAQNPDSDERWSWKTFWRRTQTDIFNQYIRFREAYDLLLLVGPDGQLVACNNIKPDGSIMDREILSNLFSRNYSTETWFREAISGKMTLVDHHISNLIHDFHEGNDPASNYYIGFAGPVKCYSLNWDHIGVIYTLVNWKYIQELIDVPRIKAYFSGLVKDKEPSPYAWIWGADAETILAHQDRSLYNEKISGPQVNLPQLVNDARSSFSGIFHEYEFRGKWKNAAYQHCNGPNQDPLNSGFGWVVGVGIDNDDIYAMAGELKRILYTSAALVSLLVILWIMAVARHTTKPILSLQKHMRKVSTNGNLEPHNHIGTGDEISDLTDDFNRMVLELKEKREQLIKAEKNAAWREMARQISHDIKNTLTPIKLSVDLLKQSFNDRSPNYQQILQQTLQLIDGQITNLQKIAVDFHEFTGGRKSILEKCDLGAVLMEVLELNQAWAKELNIGIKIETTNTTNEKQENKNITVRADCMKLHRVLTNIISNAFQAMPDGGTLAVSISNRDNWAILEIRDTGVGITEDVRTHLFEPYFTTRSKGTGLGLAIVKRVLEEINATIDLEPNNKHSGGSGTAAIIRIPIT